MNLSRDKQRAFLCHNQEYCLVDISINHLLSIIGELEATRRAMLTEIETLKEELAQISSPVPIKPDKVINDNS